MYLSPESTQAAPPARPAHAQQQVQPVLRHTRDRASVRGMRHTTRRERVTAIPIVGKRPTHSEVQTPHNREIGAQFDAAVARATRVAIVGTGWDARVLNELVAHIRLEYGHRVGQPSMRHAARTDFVVHRRLRLQLGVEATGARRRVRQLGRGRRLERGSDVAVHRHGLRRGHGDPERTRELLHQSVARVVGIGRSSRDEMILGRELHPVVAQTGGERRMW